MEKNHVKRNGSGEGEGVGGGGARRVRQLQHQVLAEVVRLVLFCQLFGGEEFTEFDVGASFREAECRKCTGRST